MGIEPSSGLSPQTQATKRTVACVFVPALKPEGRFSITKTLTLCVATHKIPSSTFEEVP
jgi:hypothetical protein